MSDWAPGDLALCVAYGPDPYDWHSTGGPVKGRAYTVDDLEFDSDGIWLHFREFPNDGWRSLGFRKITPPKADEFDREVIDLMNRKPVEV